MKLRKKQIKVPKNFPIPPWIIKNLHRGIVLFPLSFEFLHRDVYESSSCLVCNSRRIYNLRFRYLLYLCPPKLVSSSVSSSPIAT